MDLNTHRTITIFFDDATVYHLTHVRAFFNGFDNTVGHYFIITFLRQS